MVLLSSQLDADLGPALWVWGDGRRLAMGLVTTIELQTVLSQLLQLSFRKTVLSPRSDCLVSTIELQAVCLVTTTKPQAARNGRPKKQHVQLTAPRRAVLVTTIELQAVCLVTTTKPQAARNGHPKKQHVQLTAPRRAVAYTQGTYLCTRPRLQCGTRSMAA
ncbi:hypothetical protein PMIN03_007016 [Paraphaeosphaeria minitans]